MLVVLGFLTAAVLWAMADAGMGLPELVDRPLTDAEQSEVIGRNSPLIDYVYLSPIADFPRTDAVRKITIHHMAGNIGLERLGEVFSEGDRQASANYAIDVEGRIALYVEESNRAWTSGSPENDHQAITIEVANDRTGGEWHVSNASYDALIDLCIDICVRNKIEKLTYTGDKAGSLTTHNMFANTECPGPYLVGRMADIEEEVNRQLNGKNKN